MATALAQQLQQLASNFRPETVSRRVQSFLFEDTIAREISKDQYFKIGRRGIATLVRTDSRFQRFASTLFDEKGREIDPHVLTPPEAKRYKALVDDFLWLLSPYFLQPAAHEALEYLFHQFEIGTFHPDALIRCALPYHDHLYFPRLVQLLPLQKSKWRWLNELQRRGMTLSNPLLVRHLVDDESLLAQVVSWVEEAEKRECAGPAQLNLFVAAVTGVAAVVGKTGRVGDRLLAMTLPVAEQMLLGDRSADAQAAGLSVICALSAAATFDVAVVGRVVRSVLSVLRKVIGRARDAAGSARLPIDALMRALAICTAGLRYEQRLPKGSGDKLGSWVDWTEPSVLIALSSLQRAAEGRALARLVLRHLLLENDGEAASRLIAGLPPLDRSVAQPLASEALSLLTFEGEADSGAPGQNTLVQVLQALEVACNDGFGAALSSTIRKAQDAKNKTALERLYELLRESFAGSEFSALEAGGEIRTMNTAICHFNPEVRSLAASRLLAAEPSSKNGRMLALMIEDEQDPTVIDKLLSKPGAFQAVGAGIFRNAAVVLCRRMLATLRLPRKSAEFVASVTAKEVAELVLDSATSPKAKRRPQTTSPACESSDDARTVIAFFAILQRLLMVSPKGDGSVVARAAVAAARKAFVESGKTHLQGVASALASNDSAGFAKAAAGLPSPFTEIYGEAARGQSSLHFLAVAVSHSKGDDAASLFLAVRDAALEDSRVETGPGRSDAALPHGAVEAALEAVQGTSGEERWRFKLLYAALAAKLLGASDAAPEGSAKLRADAWDFVCECDLPAARDLMKGAATPDTVAAVLSSSGASEKAKLAALSNCGSAQHKYNAEQTSRCIAALACALDDEERCNGVPGALCRASAAALKRLVKKCAPDSASARLATWLAEGRGESIRLSVAALAREKRGDACIAELVGASVAAGYGSAAGVLSGVDSLEKLRGFLPLISRVAQGSANSVSKDEALLVAAGVGAVAALLRADVRKTWEKLPDRSAVFNTVCLCAGLAQPLQVVDDGAEQRWSHRVTEGTGQLSALSLSDMLADALVTPEGKAHPGASEFLALLSPGEKSQLLDAICLVASAGRTGGRRLIRAFEASLGGLLAERCQVLAEQFSEWAKAQAKAQGDGAKRRRKDVDGPVVDLTRCLELLAICHPGGSAAQSAHVSPVQTGHMCWSVLRDLKGWGQRQEELSYLLRVAMSTLANCAEEAAVGKGSKLKVDVPELLEMLGGVATHLTAHGIRCVSALWQTAPKNVYRGLMSYAVTAVKKDGEREVLKEVLHTLVPELLRQDPAGELAGLLHVVLYTYVTRAPQGDAVLEWCHTLLHNCTAVQKLRALTRFLSLQLDRDDDQDAEQERNLLLLLRDSSHCELSEEEAEARILDFATQHLCSTRTLDAVLAAEEEGGEEGGEFEAAFVELFVCVLATCEAHAAKEAPAQDDDMEEDEEEEKEGAPNSLSSRADQLLDVVADLMPAGVFVVSVQEVLSSDKAGLREKGLQLLNAKLSGGEEEGGVNPQEAGVYLRMLPDLRSVLADVDSSHREAQTALWTLEVLVRHVANKYPKSFPHFLPTLAALLARHGDTLDDGSAHLLASAALCTAHITTEVGGDRIVEHLPVFTAPLLGIASTLLAPDDGEDFTAGAAVLCEALLCSLALLLESVGDLLTPYYNKILSFAADKRCVQLAEDRTKALFEAAHENCERRLLLPALRTALRDIDCSRGEHAVLWSAVARVVRESPHTEVTDGTTPQELLGVVLQQVKAYTNVAFAPLEVIESLGDAVSALSLKLDEKGLTSVMAQLQSLCFNDEGPPKAPGARALSAFYVVVGRLQEALGPIFAGVYKTFLPQTCELLGLLQQGFKSAKGGGGRKAVATCNTIVLQTLRKLLETDEDNEISNSRELCLSTANSVLETLQDEPLLSSELALALPPPGGLSCDYQDRITQLVRPILSRLCIDCQDRTLWSKIQKALIKAHKIGSGATRLGALKALHGLYEDCGEDFASAMVAEALQPLSEALEDDDDAVAATAQDFLKTASKLTGEDVGRFVRGES
eukprot:Hpha_TRINITY_DN15766_c4_g13::TRINITY_DN15766_c4_g13_i1::g.36355::m.36355/K14550/UTP10, HEATR1; U3 small nucleolar RNA-associated protein 10